MVEAVASDEPHTAPNPAQAAIADMATPPAASRARRWPRGTDRGESLARVAIYPINTNIGTTDRS